MQLSGYTNEPFKFPTMLRQEWGVQNEAKVLLTIHLRPRAVFLASSYTSPFVLHLSEYSNVEKE